MRESIYEQSNMIIEKNATIKMYNIFKNDLIVKVPKIYSYSNKCLIMEKLMV